MNTNRLFCENNNDENKVMPHCSSTDSGRSSIDSLQHSHGDEVSGKFSGAEFSEAAPLATLSSSTEVLTTSQMQSGLISDFDVYSDVTIISKSVVPTNIVTKTFKGFSKKSARVRKSRTCETTGTSSANVETSRKFFKKKGYFPHRACETTDVPDEQPFRAANGNSKHDGVDPTKRINRLENPAHPSTLSLSPRESEGELVSNDPKCKKLNEDISQPTAAEEEPTLWRPSVPFQKSFEVEKVKPTTTNKLRKYTSAEQSDAMEQPSECRRIQRVDPSVTIDWSKSRSNDSQPFLDSPTYYPKKGGGRDEKMMLSRESHGRDSFWSNFRSVNDLTRVTLSKEKCFRGATDRELSCIGIQLTVGQSESRSATSTPIPSGSKRYSPYFNTKPNQWQGQTSFATLNSAKRNTGSTGKTVQSGSIPSSLGLSETRITESNDDQLKEVLPDSAVLPVPSVQACNQKSVQSVDSADSYNDPSPCFRLRRHRLPQLINSAYKPSAAKHSNALRQEVMSPDIIRAQNNFQVFNNALVTNGLNIPMPAVRAVLSDWMITKLSKLRKDKSSCRTGFNQAPTKALLGHFDTNPSSVSTCAYVSDNTSKSDNEDSIVKRSGASTSQNLFINKRRCGQLTDRHRQEREEISGSNRGQVDRRRFEKLPSLMEGSTADVASWGLVLLCGVPYAIHPVVFQCEGKGEYILSRLSPQVIQQMSRVNCLESTLGPLAAFPGVMNVWPPQHTTHTANKGHAAHFDNTTNHDTVHFMSRMNGGPSSFWNPRNTNDILISTYLEPTVVPDGKQSVICNDSSETSVLSCKQSVARTKEIQLCIEPTRTISVESAFIHPACQHQQDGAWVVPGENNLYSTGELDEDTPTSDTLIGTQSHKQCDSELTEATANRRHVSSSHLSITSKCNPTHPKTLGHVKTALLRNEKENAAILNGRRSLNVDCASTHSTTSTVIRQKKHSSKTNLYIRGLPNIFTEEELQNLAPDRDLIRSVKLITGSEGESYGFIDFITNAAAKSALQHIKTRNRELYVNFAYESEKDPQNIYITNIPETWTANNVEDLKKIFQPYGQISTAIVMTKRASNFCTGAGFVRFLRTEDAQRAIEGIRDAQVTIEGAKRPLEVKLADRQRQLDDQTCTNIPRSPRHPKDQLQYPQNLVENLRGSFVQYGGQTTLKTTSCLLPSNPAVPLLSCGTSLRSIPGSVGLGQLYNPGRLDSLGLSAPPQQPNFMNYPLETTILSAPVLNQRLVLQQPLDQLNLHLPMTSTCYSLPQPGIWTYPVSSSNHSDISTQGDYVAAQPGVFQSAVLPNTHGLFTGTPGIIPVVQSTDESANLLRLTSFALPHSPSVYPENLMRTELSSSTPWVPMPVVPGMYTYF
ncbi:unnamed protein product [Dicrocoelium dendriticum]|nr:unnamed protein product [Dicrocoelium dendriticum]